MKQFSYETPRNSPVTDEELLADLRRVSQALNVDTLTQKQYTINGKYDVTTVSRRFGSWPKALLKLGLTPGNIVNYPDEALFENLLTIWQAKGAQPVRRDLASKPSIISQSAYNRRFKSWTDALKAFVQYANNSGLDAIEQKENSETKPGTGRDPSLRLRFHVLKRDNFSCTACGASPAKDRQIVLHIDHIIPWSRGGQTVLENLCTLCQNCNLGKGAEL